MLDYYRNIVISIIGVVSRDKATVYDMESVRNVNQEPALIEVRL